MGKEEARLKEITDDTNKVFGNPTLLLKFAGSMVGTGLFFWGIYRLTKNDNLALAYLAAGAILLLAFGMRGVQDLARQDTGNRNKAKKG